MYNSIVVGFDESEFSKAALTEASERIKKYGGKLFLVHAVFFDEEESGIAPEQREKRFEFGRRVCYLTKDKVASQYGIDMESYVCEGDPPKVIIDIAREKKADLIATGTYGRRGLKRLLMGSVTSQVILNSPCDVLVVKRACSECTGTYISILLPYDGSESSKKALGRACELAKIDGATVRVLYVIPRYEEMVEFFRSDSIKRSLHREAEKIIDEAKRITSSHGVPVQTEIREGHAADEIVQTAEKFENDLIVMGTYGWRGVNKALMGSTTGNVITHAACPILVVK